MKKLFILLFSLAVIAAVPSDRLKTAESINKSRFASDHFIVKLKQANDIFAASLPFSTESIYERRIKEISGKLGLALSKTKILFPRDTRNNTALYNKYELETYYIVYPATVGNINSLCEEFEKNNMVDFAEPDFIGEAAGVKGNPLMPNDELFGRQWALHNEGNSKTPSGRNSKKGADLNVLNAWEIETGSEDIIVGILDSGSKTDHPDLSGRIWFNNKEVKNGRDDDGNGFIDDINGYNFAYDNPNARDDGGHGTNISGTIGASTNNTIGYAGIDQKCKLMICKNLDDNNLGEYSWWAASLYYAANNGARVLNMSEGGYDYSKTLENSINYAYDAGCFIVASMMNKNNGDSYYPASFKNVFAVGATDADDSRVREFTWGGGSNWGKHIAVVAPGNKIYGLDFKDNFNFDVYWSGTSQATAYVSGVASVLLGQDPGRTNADLSEIIKSTSLDLVGDSREDKPGWDQYYGYGRVDLYEALNYGKYPSGKKEKIKDNEEETKEPVYDDSKDNESNGIRAKATDPDNEKNKLPEDDDKRAKKPKAKDR